MRPWLNTLMGGWQLTGIYTMQSGTPLSWGNIPFAGDINDVKLDNPTRERWFNTNAGFERVNQLQSNVRSFPLRFPFLRAMGVNNFDASLIKNFAIGEGANNQSNYPRRIQLTAKFIF